MLPDIADDYVVITIFLVCKEIVLIQAQIEIVEFDVQGSYTSIRCTPLFSPCSNGSIGKRN